MKKFNVIGNTVLVVGLLTAGASFAADAITAPVKTQERTRTQEQTAEKQQQMAETRKETTARDGSGEKHQHREMNRERSSTSEMRGAGGTRPR